MCTATLRSALYGRQDECPFKLKPSQISNGQGISITGHSPHSQRWQGKKSGVMGHTHIERLVHWRHGPRGAASALHAKMPHFAINNALLD